MTDIIREFADNPEPRVACILLLDTSSSMSGDPIKELNQGIALLAETLKEDELTRMRVEIAIVTFDDNVNVIQDFISADDFVAPTLSTRGLTKMGAGITKGLSLLINRRRMYRNNNINTFKPFFFIITDGEPTDNWQGAASKLIDYEKNTGTHIFPIGVQNANLSILAQMSSIREPAKLAGLSFKEFFQWLSDSLSNVSNSNPGDQTSLAALDGWVEIGS